MNSKDLEISERVQLCYDFINGSCLKSNWPISIRIPMYIFMICTILMTVAGNLAVIISISHFKQLHSPTNYLILSMATVDLLLGSFVMPYSMVRSVENCWYFGELFCKVHTSVDIMLSTASIFHLSFISIDRYYAVCDPLRYKSKINFCIILLMIFISWTIPAIFAFGMVFLELNLKGAEVYFYNHINCFGGCFVFFTETSGVVASMISFFIPGFVMLCIYGKIYVIARRQARSIKDATNQFQFHSRLGEKQHRSRSRERKAAKTLGIVMGVFLICWSPFFICTVTDPFLNYALPPILIDALVWFGYLNSTFNPMVYAFFYMWFRKALRMIMFGKVFYSDSSRTKLFSE
ncbi:trace amine-associated receptor 1-like [Rhinatrema bivittatum]|uniref:trace amine-associated receptor 1-like n=1 Tax=Rhinatrema bivittatum TaxID=194408 RepID=UPI00112725C2|nr:trace amine-associated receptor 1-like [Rhinatrema bivittatum]XP_029452437.1 trace amine-associated receptor 1-like [Rhinatrema bivittatum]XP_029452438.1 trace amine-associated receptor 1-like [Rhinatrema bivittatum]